MKKQLDERHKAFEQLEQKLRKRKEQIDAAEANVKKVRYLGTCTYYTSKSYDCYLLSPLDLELVNSTVKLTTYAMNMKK